MPWHTTTNSNRVRDCPLSARAAIMATHAWTKLGHVHGLSKSWAESLECTWPLPEVTSATVHTQVQCHSKSDLGLFDPGYQWCHRIPWLGYNLNKTYYSFFWNKLHGYNFTTDIMTTQNTCCIALSWVVVFPVLHTSCGTNPHTHHMQSCHCKFQASASCRKVQSC